MPLILGTNSIKDTGYDVANSLRFNDGSSDNLSLSSLGTATNNKKQTLSFWCKRSTIGSVQRLFVTNGLQDPYFQFFFQSNDKLRWQTYEGSVGSVSNFITTRVFRDTSAWYHFHLVYDTTQSTSTDRTALYVNGVKETAYDTEVYPSLNSTTEFDNPTLYIGQSGSSDGYFDGYLAEFVVLDGQSITPDGNTGEFDSDSGIWKPIDVSGLTFGTNGFYLDFENSGSLGADVSGNGNNFTVNNLTSVDQSTDTCTNNFITWSALTPRSSDITLSQGNCDVTMGGISRGIFATIGVSSGKWYYEAKWVSGSFFQTGVVATDTMNDNDDVYSGKTGAFMYDQAGNIKSGGSTLASVNSLSTGDIVGVYLDLDNSKLYFAKNGTIQNSGTGIDISAYSEYTFGCAPTSAVLSGNFGNPTFSITSGNTDPNGYGNFEYSTNDGGSASFDSTAKDFYALNTKNLAEYG
jgi:hypothetical protein